MQGERQQRDINIVVAANSLEEATAGGPSTLMGSVGEAWKAAPQAPATMNVATAAAPDNDRKPKLCRRIAQYWPGVSQRILIPCIIIFMLYVVVGNARGDCHRILELLCFLLGAHFAGLLITYVRLPDMLGMMFFGALMGNVSNIADFNGLTDFVAFLSELALINIMLLAGFGLDGNAIKTMWPLILRVTCLPIVAEVGVIVLLAKYVLTMPWIWAATLGFLITAISPNVVVSVMLQLKKDRLGLNNGIHTLIYAMTTCCDIIAITAFYLLIDVALGHDDYAMVLLQMPVSIIIGVAFGCCYGWLLRAVPSKEASHLNMYRFVLILLGGVFAVVGAENLNNAPAGPLACVLSAFMANLGWKRQRQNESGDNQLGQTHDQQQPQPSKQNLATVPELLDLLWKFLKVVSFSLIGAKVRIATLNGEVVAYALGLVVLGALLRLAFTYISTCGGNLSRMERAYITISGLPKATVQAALGPIALIKVNNFYDSGKDNSENVAMAQNLLIISVVAIILTAPLGALLMERLAPRWLQRSPDEGVDAIHDGTTNNAFRQDSINIDDNILKSHL